MKKERLILLIVVALAAFSAFVWFINSSLPGSGAAVSKTDISVSSESKGNVAFVVAPHDNTDRISAVDLVIEVENGTLTDWNECGSLDTSQEYPFSELISESGSPARYSCVLIKDKDQLPPNVTISGSVACSGSEAARVTVSQRSEVAGPVEGEIYELYGLGTATVECDGTGGGGDQTPTPTPKPDETLSATFDPAECSAGVGGSCSYDLNITPNKDAKKISGLYVKLSYDEDILDFNDVQTRDVLGESVMLAQTNTTPSPSPVPQCKTDVDCASTCSTVANCKAVCSIPAGQTSGTCVNPGTTVTPQPSSTPVPSITVVTSPTPLPSTTPEPIPEQCSMISTHDKDGIFEFLYTCDNSIETLPTSVSHTFVFDAIGEGSESMRIDSIQVVGPDTLGSYSVNKGKASYDIGGSRESGNIELDLKLRLQCVVKKPVRDTKVRVNVGLGDGTLDKNVFKDVEMSFNDDGHLVGSISFDADPGKGFKVMPKYEYGMRKKICDNNATENFPGAYGCDKGNIELKAGKNTLDLSKVILLSGDLPPDGQDGITNAADQALVRNLIGKSDAESVELADVNYDNIVNQVDHACMIAALAVRWDEE